MTGRNTLHDDVYEWFHYRMPIRFYCNAPNEEPTVNGMILDTVN